MKIEGLECNYQGKIGALAQPRGTVATQIGKVLASGVQSVTKISRTAKMCVFYHVTTVVIPHASIFGCLTCLQRAHYGNTYDTFSQEIGAYTSNVVVALISLPLLLSVLWEMRISKVFTMLSKWRYPVFLSILFLLGELGTGRWCSSPFFLKR
jgi:hypothetical protein